MDGVSPAKPLFKIIDLCIRMENPKIGPVAHNFEELKKLVPKLTPVIKQLVADIDHQKLDGKIDTFLDLLLANISPDTLQKLAENTDFDLSNINMDKYLS